MKRLIFLLLMTSLLAACGKPTVYEDEVMVPRLDASANECIGRNVGEAFTCSDGCNTCSCNSQGRLSSTLMACGN